MASSRSCASSTYTGDFHFAQVDVDKRLAYRRGTIREKHRMQPWLQIVRGIRSVGCAVEETAKHAVAFLANGADASEHSIERHAQDQQRM